MTRYYDESDFEAEIQRNKKSAKPANNRRKKQSFQRQIEEELDEYYENQEDD